MSLINQMLQDLEKRQPHGGLADLPPGVVSAAEKPRPATRWQALALISLATAVAVFAIRLVPDRKPEPPAARVIQEAVLPPLPAVPVVPAADEPAPAVPGNPAATSAAPKATVVSTTPAGKAQPAKPQAPLAAQVQAPPVPSPAKAVPGPAAAKAAAAKPGGGRIDKSINSGGGQADAYYQQALEAYTQGRAAESAEKLQQALAVEPGNVPSRQLLTRQLLEQRRLDEARGVLREGMRLQPSVLQWPTLLARIELEKGDLAAARAAVDSALPQGAASADLQSLAGAVAQRQGKPDEAAEFYRRALQLKPADGRAWIGLGVALEAEGHRPEAREAFRRAQATGNLPPELEALAQRKLQ